MTRPGDGRADDSGDVPPWRRGLADGADSLFAGRPRPVDAAEYPTLTYEVTGRIARMTFNRPERGNAITPDTPWTSPTRWSGPTWTHGCT